MNKFKLFIENFLIYGFGGIINKIIPLLMIPVVVRLMPDSSYFGISDLTNTIVSLFSAFAMMGMYDSMYRLFFEEEDESYKKSVCSTAFFITVIASIIICSIMILCRKYIVTVFFGDTQYSYLLYISAITTLVSTANGIISAPTRMQNKRRIYLVTNIMSSILGYAIAVLLLVGGYYIIALPMASAVSHLILQIIFWTLNHSWFELKTVNSKLIKPLLRLALPLVPNFFIYWIFNSCDKLMITNLIGIDATGVYSVSAKIGQISQLIYTAFAGGWQFFAFSTMKEGNQVKTNSKVFEYLGAISFSATMLLCTFSYVIFRLFFPQQYLMGYIAAPYLFLAPLLQMLYQVIANQFLVIKKTWPILLILSNGAVINVLANAKLIPILGIEGAALATLFGYFTAVVICVVVLLKMKLLFISKRMVVVVMLMLLYLLIWRLLTLENILINGLIAIIFIGVYLFLYKEEIKYIKNARHR